MYGLTPLFPFPKYIAHPKTRLHQNKLKNYRDKLNEYYGLSAEKFEMAMESVRGVAEDCECMWDEVKGELATL